MLQIQSSSIDRVCEEQICPGTNSPHISCSETAFHRRVVSPQHVLGQAEDGIFEANESKGEKVHLVGAKSVSYDLDENILADTLEEFHDGPKGRFALAVRDVLKNKEINVTEDDFVTDDFWNKNFRKFGGLLENQWYDGLSKVVKQLYNVSVTAQEIGESMTQVLNKSSASFCQRVQPVPHVIPFILAAKLFLQGRIAICTTSAEDIMEPLMGEKGHNIRQHFVDGKREWYSATKKKKTDDGSLRFSGEALSEICSTLKVDPSNAFMTGDSIADFGAAAMAGYGFCILRIPSYLIEQKGGREGAVRALKEQIAKARSDNADTPGFKDTVAIIVDSYAQVEFLQVHSCKPNAVQPKAKAFVSSKL